MFIDESGDFGTYERHAPYYLVSMVLHDQSVDISDRVKSLEYRLGNLGYHQHAIHTGPLIRRESVYLNDKMEQRKHLFNILFYFARLLDIHYICAAVDKHECVDTVDMTAKLSRSIGSSLAKHADFFNSYDRIIIYYDNGQVELTKIITTLFTVMFPHVEFRKVQPVDYKLFQVADLICTTELLSIDESLAHYKYVFHCLCWRYNELVSKKQGARGDLNSSLILSTLIPLPPLEKQREIVSILDRFDALCTDLSSGLPAEIEARQKQYEYYRDKLLTFSSAT